MPPWMTLWRLKKSTFTRSYTNKRNIAHYFMEVLVTAFMLAFCYAVKAIIDLFSLNLNFWWVYMILGILGMVIVPLLPVIIKIIAEETSQSKMIYLQKLQGFSFIDRILIPLSVLGFKMEYSDPDDPLRDIAFRQVGVNARALSWLRGDKIVIQDTNASMTKAEYVRYSYSKARSKPQAYFKVSISPFFKFRFYIIRKALQFVTLKIILRSNLLGYGILFLQDLPYANIYTAAKLGIAPDKAFKMSGLGIPIRDYEDSKDIPIEWLEKAFPIPV